MMSQVQYTLRTIGEDDVVELEDTDCSICLTDFELGSDVCVTWCGHVFHVGCGERWLEEVWSKASGVSKLQARHSTWAFQRPAPPAPRNPPSDPPTSNPKRASSAKRPSRLPRIPCAWPSAGKLELILPAGPPKTWDQGRDFAFAPSRGSLKKEESTCLRHATSTQHS